MSIRDVADAGAPLRLTTHPGIDNSPAWSPDGKYIACTRFNKGESAILTSPTKLVSSTQYDGVPQFSPDGRKIVFQSERSGLSDIWVCDREGANARQLTFIGGPLVGTPRWSPDARHIAFDARAEGHSDIYVVDAEGGRPRRITTETSNDVVPSWSRNGRFVYFASNRTGMRPEVWKAPAAGGEARQVTKQGGFAAFESPMASTSTMPNLMSPACGGFRSRAVRRVSSSINSN